MLKIIWYFTQLIILSVLFFWLFDLNSMIMVNDIACNDIVHSVSVVTFSVFCKKTYSVKTGWHYKVIYICYITFIESDYSLWIQEDYSIALSKSVFLMVLKAYMSTSSFQNRTSGLKLNLYAFLCYCLATMHVRNNQVNLNSIVAFAFMEPLCIQKTYAIIDITIQANILHLLLTLSQIKGGQNGEIVAMSTHSVVYKFSQHHI